MKYNLLYQYTCDSRVKGIKCSRINAEFENHFCIFIDKDEEIFADTHQHTYYSSVNVFTSIESLRKFIRMHCGPGDTSSCKANILNRALERWMKLENIPEQNDGA